MEILPTPQAEAPPPLRDQANGPSSIMRGGKAGEGQQAGFIRRVIAYMIDSFVLLVLFLFFIFSGLMGIRFSGGLEPLFDSGFGSIFLLGFFFLYMGYFTYFHACGGQTPAKMILRIKVVREDGHSLSHLHAFMRTFGFFVSHLFFGFGFLLTIVERKKRALHDLLSGTQVILSP